VAGRGSFLSLLGPLAGGSSGEVRFEVR
jgi:hypothetical protein